MHPPAAHPSAAAQNAPAARLACDCARTARIGGEDPGLPPRMVLPMFRVSDVCENMSFDMAAKNIDT